MLTLGFSVVSNSLWLQGLYPTRLLCLWDFPGKNIGVGCHFFLQGIFLTQGLSPSLLHLLHWQVEFSPLSHQGSPVQLVYSFNFARSLNSRDLLHNTVPTLNNAVLYPWNYINWIDFMLRFLLTPLHQHTQEFNYISREKWEKSMVFHRLVFEEIGEIEMWT